MFVFYVILISILTQVGEIEQNCAERPMYEKPSHLAVQEYVP